MITRKEKISIVLPVYNGANYIADTVKYIQKSTYENLEILLINDGSTDGSETVIRELMKTDHRLVLYSKTNGGVVSARNFGVEKATGDFICFCDQDDIVMPETYQRLYEKMQSDGSDVAICSSGRSVDGKLSVFDVMEDGTYTGTEIDENLLFPLLFNGFQVPYGKQNINRYPHIWTCMFRLSFWQRHAFRFRAYINFEDDLLMKVETLSKADKVSTISYVGYYWRVNLKSETYAHKYVSDIGRKQQQALEDMRVSIQNRNSDERLLETFEQVTLCKQYLDAVHNLTSPYRKKNLSFIRKYYKTNIYGRNFKHAIAARKMLKKGRVKPRILLPLLAGKMTLLSFWMEWLLDRVLLVTLHSPLLTRLERRMKQGD